MQLKIIDTLLISFRVREKRNISLLVLFVHIVQYLPAFYALGPGFWDGQVRYQSGFL